MFIVDLAALSTTSIRHLCYALLHFLVRNRRHPRGLKCPKFSGHENTLKVDTLGNVSTARKLAVSPW